ncbi:hypothetical protein COT60_02765, partial [Candidatus Pacearchaeota archaeon CG09_land_8_20_14_0_10_30_9]
EVMDKWIISRLNSLIKEVGKNLENYNTMKASFEIKNFIEELSTWYVRNSRERFNEGDINAKKTLQYVLVETSKIIAPIMPFVAEKIFQTINGKKSSVHLENWPKLDEKKINKKLESEMTYARTIVSEGLKQRDQNNVPLKWPLSEVEVNSKTKISNELKKVIIQELNVKKYSEKLHEKDELKVNINFNLNSKLKAEGFAREISRKVQALRKKMGLNKENFIELTLEIDKNFQQILEKQKKLLKERTNSKKIEFVEKIINPRGEIEEFTIKERTGKIQIVRLIGSN